MGTRPSAFPGLSDPDDFWAWYRNNNPYATVRPPRRHSFRLLRLGNVAID
jgi:hypothetical protein